MQPGEYDLSVEMAEFKRFVRTGIVLRVGDSLEIPVALELTPFPGNVILQSRMDPIAAKFISLFPNPTGPGLRFTNASNVNVAYTRAVDDNRVEARVDHSIGYKQRFFGA